MLAISTNVTGTQAVNLDTFYLVKKEHASLSRKWLLKHVM